MFISRPFSRLQGAVRFFAEQEAQLLGASDPDSLYDEGQLLEFAPGEQRKTLGVFNQGTVKQLKRMSLLTNARDLEVRMDEVEEPLKTQALPVVNKASFQVEEGYVEVS